LISWWKWWFFFSPVGKFVFKFVSKLAKNEFFEFYNYKVLEKIKKI